MLDWTSLNNVEMVVYKTGATGRVYRYARMM